MVPAINLSPPRAQVHTYACPLTYAVFASHAYVCMKMGEFFLNEYDFEDLPCVGLVSELVLWAP